ncbi:MAG: NAD(P)H-binding protein [Odoribacter sp.]|nr:NAD(P)H-binding protein [Odoribacter sp.]
MKEVALIGMDCQIFSDVLSAFLHRNIAVNAIVPNPEHVMIDDVDLTVSPLREGNVDSLVASLEGYHDAVMVFSDDQTDVEANNFALRNYSDMVSAARRAGVSRLIVVGSPEATAYFMGDLRRQNELDWVFISTEGDYADRTVNEVVLPHFHREEYYA